MSTTFERLEEQLGDATKYVLAVTLLSLGLTLACALLELPQAVETFLSVASILVYMFVALFLLFSLGWLVLAITHAIEQRKLDIK